MIKLQHALPSLLAGFAVTLAGCTSEPASSQGAIIQTPCAMNSDCPANFECEIEIEHGQTTSFCKSHDEDVSCPAGLELEIEHGQTFCKPHGGDHNAGDDQGGTDDGGIRNDDNRGPGSGSDDRGSDTDDDDRSGSGHG